MAAPLDFSAPYAPDDGAVLTGLCRIIDFDAKARTRIENNARSLIEGIRDRAGRIGGLEDFLRDYALSTREGLALMVLAEALLRIPDAATQEKLIEDKLGTGDWQSKQKAGTWFVSMATWGLGLSARIVHSNDDANSILGGITKRLGMPAIREATKQAMHFMGHQFVLGETIQKALAKAAPHISEGYQYSFDMLGEGARTMADAEHYFTSYADAIEAIGKKSGNKPLPDRMGISVKLSALHPRFEAVQKSRIMDELVPRLTELAIKAKQHDLNFTIDAEECDRLEISLEVIAATLSNPHLAGWDGFGLAIQAYQKRALQVINWANDLATSLDRKMMVRLVKGAYWDTEVKHAQELGVADFPVFTRKPATDVSYRACAMRLLECRKRLFPQFATHNALTVAAIVEMAGEATGFEFQRLHGMGEDLYKIITEERGIPCRIYAPVGGHRDLLAYLVRRLLENGANSSFVAKVGDPNVPVSELLEHPEDDIDFGRHPRHMGIKLPGKLFAKRPNSAGLDFGSTEKLTELVDGVARANSDIIAATSIIGGKPCGNDKHDIISPVDAVSIVGSARFADIKDVERAMSSATHAHTGWEQTPVSTRAEALNKMADLLEQNRDEIVSLLCREAGKTFTDGIAEIREAVDFCRYYAVDAQTKFGAPTLLPGPTGEENRYSMRGRGVFVCISPWNFPLAIFLGQISAALVAGNCVIAKPAEATNLIAHLAVKLFHQAGIPADVLQLVLGKGRDIGAALIAHPQVAGVAFTGSTATAQMINRTLASKSGPIVPFIAETGGINAMIVDASALPEQVCDDVLLSAFRSSGQRCSALRLLCLQDDVADRMIDMIKGAAKELSLGDPSLPETDMGPVIDKAAQIRIMKHVNEMKASHSVMSTGREPSSELTSGHWVFPHIVELNSPDDLEEEVFGPVLHIVRWKESDLDTILDQIDAKGFGLTLGIHSRIEAFTRQVINRLAHGNVYINRNMIGAIVGSQPFGGSGLSGTGPKAGGPNYLTRFGREQHVSENTAAAGGNASLLVLDDG
jgi:RHH-type proline utilization regulon transcriptional repressor/proline dehydrogenase/delta 1-pyrroline-5-carboxylate dehydrogenase